jgi:hypothetical protein
VDAAARSRLNSLGRRGGLRYLTGESFTPGTRPPMEALIPLLLFLIVFGALNIYEYGSLD